MFRFAFNLMIQPVKAVDTVEEAIAVARWMNKRTNFRNRVTVYDTTTKKHYDVDFINNKLKGYEE